MAAWMNALYWKKFRCRHTRSLVSCTGQAPPPAARLGTMEAHAGLEADHDVQSPPAVARVPEIHGPDLPRPPQLQCSGEQARGIHASNPPAGITPHHNHPPQTAKGPNCYRAMIDRPFIGRVPHLFRADEAAPFASANCVLMRPCTALPPRTTPFLRDWGAAGPHL